MISQPSLPRREFLQKTGAAVAGFFLFSAPPPWLFKQHRRSYVERSFYSMGSMATVCAYGESRSHLHHTVTRVIEEFGRLDALLSVYRPGSAISRINAQAGRQLAEVGDEVIGLLQSSNLYHEITKGTFDITVEPLMRLWGFRQDPPRRSLMPSDTEVASTLECVGMHQIMIDTRRQAVGLKSPRSRLDLGGLAVGYAVDRAVLIMKSEGIESAFINHSGDAYALGVPEESAGWLVAIPDPLDPKRMLTTFEIRDRALSTSGSYEKFVTIGKRNFGHILDPSTGLPSESMLSATLEAPTSLAADALSTGCYALGPEKAAAVVEAFPDVGFLGVNMVEGESRLEYLGSWR